MLKFLIVALTATAALACSWNYPIWIPRSVAADPLYRFVKGEKAGYIDGAGRVVLQPQFAFYRNVESEFRDGLLRLRDVTRFVDRTGNVVIDGNHLSVSGEFSEGLAYAQPKGETLWGYIDTSGGFAISPRFEGYPKGSLSSFSEGLAKIYVRGKAGYIDRSGEFVIEPRFLRASDFRDGIARVVVDGPCLYWSESACLSPSAVTVGGEGEPNPPRCKYTFIDRTGRVTTEARFEDARDFADGLAPVAVTGRWGYADKTGAEVIPPSFEDAASFSGGLARVRDRGLYGYIDRSGSFRIPPRFKEAQDFKEGFAAVSEDWQRWLYIDEQGNRAFPGDFITASHFFQGLAHVELLTWQARAEKATFAYIDTSGRRDFSYWP